MHTILTKGSYKGHHAEAKTDLKKMSGISSMES